MKPLNKKTAPQESPLPEATDQGGKSLITTSVPEYLTQERMRAILREAEERYRHELLPDEERMLLLDRIKRLKKSLGL